jgi:prepilin-type N-terminal cleavage/methylation domain-containing protein
MTGPTDGGRHTLSRGRRPRPFASAAGVSLIEILVVLVVAGVLAALGVPPLLRASASLRLEMAAAEIASTLRLTRAYALRHGVRVAVRFENAQSAEVAFSLYRDGDGDGVRNADIAAGVDPREQPARRLTRLGRGVRFGFPPGPLPPAPGGGRLVRGDPVRFNRSDLASFDPSGTSTPGTVYLTDGVRGLVAVRVASRAGRVRTMRWDPERRAWRLI